MRKIFGPPVLPISRRCGNQNGHRPIAGYRIFKSSVEMAGKLAYNKAKKLGGTVLAGLRRQRMSGKTGPRTGAGK